MAEKAAEFRATGSEIYYGSPPEGIIELSYDETILLGGNRNFVFS